MRSVSENLLKNSVLARNSKQKLVASSVDILSAAVEASAKKKQRNSSGHDTENSNPNLTFDIGQCQKGSTEVIAHVNNVMMSPSFLHPKSKPHRTNFEESTLNRSLFGSPSTVKERAQQTVQSNSIVNRNDGSEKDSYTENGHQTVRAITSKTASSNSHMDTNNSSNNSSSGADWDGFGDNNNNNDDDQYITEDLATTTQSPSRRLSTSSTNTYASTSSQQSNTTNNNNMSIEDIRELLLDHIVDILNTGTYDELIALKGIGKKRAMNLMAERNSSADDLLLTTIYDLEDTIGMNSKVIEKFIRANVTEVVMSGYAR